MENNTAGEEAPVPVQANVEASAAAVPVHAGAVQVRIPEGWNPYESPEEYAPSENPYDTSIVDPEEVLSSDVDSDDEAVHTKARHVLRRLQSSQYDRYFKNDVYGCPFCTTRNLRSTEFNAVVTHAEAVKTSSPNVGETVNRYAYTAKHIALGIHLRNLQQVAITEGRMQPIKLKVRKPKGYKFQKRMREEDEAEAARRRG